MSARLIDQLTQGFGVRPSLRVKRALFGPVDHEENYRFVQRELARNRQEASQRWNYDFSRDVPLPGRYEWEKGGGPIVKKKSDEGQSSCDKDQRVRNRRSRSKQQTQITDYLQHRKRSKSKVKVQERRKQMTAGSKEEKEAEESSKSSSEEQPLASSS